MKIGMGALGQGVDISSGFDYLGGDSVPLASMPQSTPSSDALTQAALLQAGFTPSQIGPGQTITTPSSGMSSTTLGLIAVAAIAMLLLLGKK